MNQSAAKRSAADQTIEQLQHELAEAKAREQQALANKRIARSDARKLGARLRSVEEESGKQNSIDSVRYNNKQYDKNSFCCEGSTFSCFHVEGGSAKTIAKQYEK